MKIGGIALPKEPGSVVSFCPSITETLLELGLAERLVGVSAYCPLFFKGLGKPIVGSYTDVNLKLLKELDPELILTMGRAQLGLSRRLRKEGFKVFRLRFPASAHGVIENLVVVGALTGRYAEAQAAARKVARALEGKGEAKARPRVYFEAWMGEPVSTGALTFTNELIYLAGGVNVFQGKPEAYFKPDLEEVEGANPDALIFEIKAGNERAANLISRRGWGELRAVKLGRIIELRWPRASITHPAPSTVRFLGELSSRLKELFG